MAFVAVISLFSTVCILHIKVFRFWNGRTSNFMPLFNAASIPSRCLSFIFLLSSSASQLNICKTKLVTNSQYRLIPYILRVSNKGISNTTILICYQLTIAILQDTFLISPSLSDYEQIKYRLDE